MKEKVEILCKEIEEKISSVITLKDLNDLKVEYMGKKGIITELYSKMKEIPNEEKKEYGIKINELKDLFNKEYDVLKDKFLEEELNKKLESEAIDVTLSGMDIKCGAPHILDKVIEQVEDFYISMGFDVETGPEVEKDIYNF